MNGFSSANETERFWRKHARLAVARFNFARWLAVFLPWLFGGSVAFAAALLVMRGLKMNINFAWMFFGAMLLLCAIGALLAAKRRFINTSDALARFDAVLHLHNRLTAAAAGIGRWPAKPNDYPDSGFRWRWRSIAPPVLASLLLVFAAARVPLTFSNHDAAHPTQQPLAWTQVESWAQTLAEQNLVEEQKLEKLREAVNDLKKQPGDQWFSQSSLEAGDTLRQQTEQSLRALERDLRRGDEAISAMEKLGDSLSAADSKLLGDALQKAVQGLEMGNLPLNKELLDQLKNIDPSQLKQLSAEQLAQLQKRLKEGLGACQQCLGNGDENDSDALLAVIQNQRTGAGGKGGGGGVAPLSLKEASTDLHTKQTEALAQSEDMSRATPGDLLGVSKGEHDVDKTQFQGPASGGAISSNGAGGEAVWRNSLVPREREVLQRYFK